LRVEQPRRIRRSYRQRLCAPPERVLPLLCPVRECDWVRGWEPGLVLSNSGLAEPDAIFVTPGEPEAIWVVTRHEPEHLYVEMWKLVPGVVATKLEIQVGPDQGGCWADVAYTHTVLGEAGHAVADAFTESAYERFMRDWEAELNHYLETGRKLGA